MESKVIGEGQYGCIHNPALKCKYKKISNYNDKISKIMTKEAANEEMDEYSEINAVDPENKYHLEPDECTPDDSIKIKEYVLKCKKGQTIISDFNNYKLILMKYGGPDLKKIFTQNMKKTPDNRERISNFWEDALDLFKAVKLFLENGLIHHDFKPDNIVYNEQTNNLKVIDFGLLKKKEFIIQKSKESNYGFSIFWFNFPPEMFLYDKIVYEGIKEFGKYNPNKTDMRTKIRVYFRGKNEKDYTESIKFLMAYVKSEHQHPQFKENIINGFLDFVNYTISTRYEGGLSHEDFLRKSIDTIDSYGLGMTLMFVLVRVHHLMEKDLVQKLHTLFYNMFHPDLRKRMNINDALQQYDNIITSHSLPPLPPLSLAKLPPPLPPLSLAKLPPPPLPPLSPVPIKIKTRKYKKSKSKSTSIRRNTI